MKNKIVVHGSQYKDNFGDTLLVKVIQEELKDKFEVRSSAASRKVLNDLRINKASKLDSLMAKHFIFGGGGYFGQPNKNVDKWSTRFIIRHGVIGIARRLLSKKYIFVGTGFGPLTHPLAARVAKFVLEGADSASLRDKESVEYASRLTTRTILNETADLVPAYISKRYLRNAVQKKIILHMHLPVGDFNKLDKIVSAYIGFRNESFDGYLIELISDTENDEQQTWFFDHVRKTYPEVVVSPYSNFEDTLNKLSCASFVVTNKLHVAIVSISMGVPVASIFMHSKTKRFFEQINRPNSAIPIDSLNDKIHLQSFFCDVYRSGLDKNAIEELIRRSDMNIDILKEWLSNG